MKGAIKVGIVFVSVVMLALVISYAMAGVESVTTSNSFKVTWYDCSHGLTQHFCHVDIQNLNASVARDFNLSLLFNETNYEINKTNAVIKEWKGLPTPIPTYDIRLVQQNCTTFDGNNNTQIVDCSFNETYQNGKVIRSVNAWKSSKANLFKTGANLKASYGLINIPKFESKEKFDDFNDTETVNGTKRFLIEWTTPIISSGNSFGSSGLIAFVDDNSGNVYHPFWNTSWYNCNNVTFEERAGFNRVEEGVRFTVTLSTALANGTDIALVDTGCRNGGNQLATDIVSISGTSYTISAVINATKNSNNTFAIYTNNSAPPNNTFAVTDLRTNLSTANTLNGSMENKYMNITYQQGGLSVYRMKVDDRQSPTTNLADTTYGWNHVTVNGSSGALRITMGICQLKGFGITYLEVNCSQGRFSMFNRLYTRSKYIELHFGNPTRDEANSIMYGHNPSNAETIFVYNTSASTGGWTQGNVSVRGIVGKWSSGAGSENVTGLLYNTSQNGGKQTEYETFINNPVIHCIGIGCQVGSYQGNGSYMYETDFRLIQGSGLTTNASRIGYLETEWEKMMQRLDKSVTLGAVEGQNTAPSLSALTILPNPAYITSVLNVSVVLSDDQADAGTINFTWYRNGTIVQSSLVNAANATNMTAISTFTFVHYDNISVKAVANDSAAGTAVSTANLTISDTPPIINRVFTNQTYFNFTGRINITTNVTDADGASDLNVVSVKIFNPSGTLNETINLSGSGGNNFSTGYTVGLTEGNWSVEITANDSSNTQATRVNGSFIVDTTVPIVYANRSDNGIMLGQSVNLTANLTEGYIDTTLTRIFLYNPSGTLNYQRNFTGNTTFQFNTTGASQSGNYTLVYNVTDLAGNANSTSVRVGFGRINISVASYLTALNYTSVDASLGESAPLGNNTFSDISFQLAVSVTSDGELSSRTNRSQINLANIVANWTTSSIVVLNSTSGRVPYFNNTDIVNFSTNSMSSGQTDTFTISLDTISTLNYSVHKASSGFYYYMVSANTNSFNEYVTVSLPSSEIFDTSSTHPRYFVCTSVTRGNPPTCNTFTTAVDVTSTNNENNGVAGYNVNMKVKATGAAINNLTYQANHTDSLIQIIMVAGAFQAGSQSSGSSSPAGGGGGGAPPVTSEPGEGCGYYDASRNICCPPDYTHYNEITQLCEKPSVPITGLELGILNRELYGGFTVFHGLLVLGAAVIISNKKTRTKLGLKKV